MRVCQYCGATYDSGKYLPALVEHKIKEWHLGPLTDAAYRLAAEKLDAENILAHEMFCKCRTCKYLDVKEGKCFAGSKYVDLISRVCNLRDVDVEKQKSIADKVMEDEEWREEHFVSFEEEGDANEND